MTADGGDTAGPEDTRGAPGAADAARHPDPRLPNRLSTRLLWITMLSIMVAEVLIFVPSIANFRREWLRNKVETVAVASLTAELGADPRALLTPDQEASLLQALDAELIAVASGGVSRLLARSDDLGAIDLSVDLGRADAFGLIGSAFATLFGDGDRRIRVVGPIGDGEMTGEVVLHERPLRQAMLRYSRNILLLSLAIASFAGILVYLAISAFLLRPIRRMTQAMIRFGENPEDPGRIIAATGRRDEIGRAEAELADMQVRLSQTLREQRHLADLGLAVSKINHDLRNILASAQLISDRLSDLPDPRVQRFAPMLIRSLDRALAYTNSVLAYGRAVESKPVRRKVLLRLLVEEIFAAPGVAPKAEIEFRNAVPDGFEIEVDPDQFFRALGNLVRNATEALDGAETEAVVRRITVSAGPEDGGARIAVEDTGPGLSERARENLFQAFRGSTRSGGTGLGLAIAAEIVRAHGGRIRLAEGTASGARFEIDLPTSPGARPRPGAMP